MSSLRALSTHGLRDDGTLIVRSDKHRSLEANKDECLRKVLRLLTEAGKRALPVATSPEQLHRVETL